MRGKWPVSYSYFVPRPQLPHLHRPSLLLQISMGRTVPFQVICLLSRAQMEVFTGRQRSAVQTPGARYSNSTQQAHSQRSTIFALCPAVMMVSTRTEDWFLAST